ncbi:MAG: cyclic nucleotide-binding domain-containing protein [Candidatus Dormibacteraeota bacterium]|nr:cyclic nucleotide-binding domain-containing protein [Candidatus Dormibacteraeota bacterium]
MFAGTSPGSLPGQLTSFVGRSRDLAEGAALLARARLLTITGAGGSGKTRLAVQLAAESAPAHPGGAWFCDLAAVADATGIVEAAARALGLPPEAGGDPSGALARELRGKRALLLVDNCEHVLAGAASLVEGLLLACPDLRLLATSQEPLGVPGEVLLRLGALADEEALALFAERVRQALPRFALEGNARAQALEICRRLDGIPLALELAAARARTVPLANLVAELDDRFGILVGNARSAPTRQQTLEAAVAWTYSLIPPLERSAMQRLSVLPGPFTLATAREVAAGDDLGPGSVAGAVAGLVDRSVLELDSEAGRYRMLETLRAFAFERLEEAGESAAVLGRAARHAAASDANRTGLALARRALARLAEGDPERLEMLDLLAGQAERVGDYAAGTGALEEMRAALAATEDLSRLANVEMRISSSLPLDTGELDRAAEAANRAREIYRQLGDDQAVLQVDNELAWVAGLGGDLAGQVRLAGVVVERAAAVASNGPAHLHSLGCLGCGLLFVGRFAEADAALRHALRIATSQDDLYQVGWLTGILALELALTAGPPAGEQLLAEVRPRVAEHLDPVVVESSLLIKILAGNHRAALDEFDAESATIASFAFRGAWIFALAAGAAGEVGEIGTAEALQSRARALWAGRDVYYQSRAAHWLEGTIAWNRGDLGLAIEEARKGAEELLAMDALPIAALALRDLADMLTEAGREEEAAEAEASLAAAVRGVDSPFLHSLAEFAAPTTGELLGKLGYRVLHARSLAASGRTAEAAASLEKLGALRQRDRLLAGLARSGQAPPSPVAMALRRCLLFDSVAAADLELLAGAAARGTYRAGEEVQRRHETAREVGVVEAGAVRLALPTPDGPRLLGDIRPGELLGERAVIGGERHALDGVATEATSVVWLPVPALLGFIRSRPALAERLLVLLSQRLRQEAAVTGDPEPAEVAARVLGRLPGVPGDEAGAPAFEILPVRLVEGLIHLLRPTGSSSWLVDAAPGRSAGELVGASLAAVGLDAAIVHSTSWRQVGGRLVLTYLAVLSERAAAPGFEDSVIGRTDLARGGTHGAPAAIDVTQVVEHGLRHLSWLSRDDPVLGPALGSEWLAKVAEYQPEPFRVL